MDNSTLELVELVLGPLIGVFASSGFWIYMGKRNNDKDQSKKLLLGLACERIVTLGLQYVDRGWVTKDEYDLLCDSLYTPYKDMGGNGTAKKVMDEVDRLPIRKGRYTEPDTQPLKPIENGEN